MVDDLTRAVAVSGNTAVAEDALPAELLRLGKELQCPICLGILKAPTARLPCCHYFCLDCINESLKHRTACPSCKLFARKRDVTRDFKIDRVATLYSQLEAATGRFVYCSQPPSPAAPPEIAAAAEAFVVPSPPQEEYETAREEFGLELSEAAAVAAPARAVPVLQLWAASQDFMQSLTQHSGGWPSMTPPTQFAAEQQQRPPTGCGVSALQSVELQESMVEETQGFGSGQQVQGRVGAAPGSTAAATGKAMERSDDTCQKSGHGASERDEFLVGGEDALLLGGMKPVAAAGRRGRRRKNETETRAEKTTSSAANRNPLHDVSNKSLRGGRRPAASKAPVGSSGAVSEGVPTTPAADSGQKLTLPPPSSSRRVPARLQVWTCRMCTLENAGTAKKCAVCDTPRTSSGALAAATTAADPVTVEEVATRHRHGNSTISDFQEPDCPPLELARRFNIGDGQGEQGGLFPAAETSTTPSRKKKRANKKPADEGPKESGSRKKARKGGAVAQSSGATAKAIRLSAAGGRNGVVTALAPNATPSGDDISAPNKSKAKGTGRQHQRVANEMGAESASAAAGEAPQGECLEAELSKSDQRAKKRKAAGCVRVRANKASASRQRVEKSAKVSSGVPIPAAVPPPPLVTPPTRAVEPLAASDSVKVADHAKSPTVAAGGVVTTAAHDLKWARSMRSSWTFLGSGLAEEMDKENLYALATASGARVVDSYDSRVTHVVCGVDTEGRAKRTAKYMHGILEGAWVVSAQWMTACILAGSPVDEKDFEVVGDSGGGTGGPAAGRARREEGRPKLLAGKEVVLHGSFTSKEAVKAIVTAAGGRLLPRLAPSATAKDSLVVVIEGKSAGQGGGGRSARQTDGPATALSLAVSLNWLMDSVGAHALQAPEAYRL